MSATGLGLAASVFPTAGKILDGLSDTAGSLLPEAVSMLGSVVGLSGLGNILTNAAPTNKQVHLKQQLIQKVLHIQLAKASHKV